MILRGGSMKISLPIANDIMTNLASHAKETGDLYQQNYKRILRSMVHFRTLANTLMGLSLLLALYLMISAGRYQKPENKMVMSHQGNALGSRLSHLIALEDGWQFEFAVEQVVFQQDRSGQGLEETRLENVKIHASHSQMDQNISFYAPFAYWGQEENQFLLFGGCRIWQDDVMDISTESVHIDMEAKKIAIDSKLQGQYAKNWFFTANSATWDVEEDHFIFDGYVVLDQRFEEIQP